MKVKLAPGAELDILTQSELHATMAQVMSGFARGPLTIRHQNVVGLDASGNTVVGSTITPFEVFKCPAGYQFGLHRLSLNADGTSFADPFTNGEGEVQLLRQGELLDGISLGAPGIPMIFSYGTADAPVYDNNDSVDLLILGGPASTSVRLLLQGTLEPITVV